MDQGFEGKEVGRSSREVCKGRDLDVLHSHMICFAFGQGPLGEVLIADLVLAVVTSSW